MTVTVNSILADARTLLLDPSGVRWPDTELLNWFNDGVRQCVLIKPDCYPLTEEYTCIAGHKQWCNSLNYPIVQLIDILANTTGGFEPVTFVKRNIMDLENPSWRSDPASSTIQYFMYDDSQRDYFYVYPPASVGATIEVLYAGIPSPIALGSAIPLQDIYAPALINYVVWRAFSKDSDFSGNPQTANMYYAMFLQSLTGKTAADQQIESPDRKPPPAVVEAIG